jgi:microcystin-dependent protein
MHQGQGAGLSNRTLGESGGEEAHTLSVGEMPTHGHTLNADAAASATAADPSGKSLGKAVAGTASAPIYAAPSSFLAMANEAIGAQGNSQPHPNRQPYLGIEFIIALQGIFPSRN